jgi:hypothetical protein
MAKIRIGFKFHLGDKVRLYDGTEGIVTMLGVDNSGVQYYVQTAMGGAWWSERQIDHG